MWLLHSHAAERLQSPSSCSESCDSPCSSCLSFHWANENFSLLARGRNTKGTHASLQRGESCFIALHLTPGEMCSCLVEDRWNRRNKRNCVWIEGKPAMSSAGSDPCQCYRAQLQVGLLAASVTTGSPEKGIKINIKVKNNCKVLELLHSRGGSLCSIHSSPTMHPGPLRIVPRPVQPRDTFRF